MSTPCTHFSTREHLNLQGQDPELGPVIVSLRDLVLQVLHSYQIFLHLSTPSPLQPNPIPPQDQSELTHLILRTSSATLQQYTDTRELQGPRDIATSARCLPASLAWLTGVCRALCPSLSLAWLTPVVGRKASSLLADFDTRTRRQEGRHTFGLLLQRRGQAGSKHCRV